MKDTIFAKRLILISAVIAVVFIALFSRAIHLQVISHGELAKLAEKQHLKKDGAGVDRGVIYDRNMEKIVEDIMAFSIGIETNKIDESASVAKQLASITGINKKLLQDKLSTKKFEWIVRKADPKINDAILKANITAVSSFTDSKRYYHYETLALPLIGGVGIDSQALGGLERYYDRYLRVVNNGTVWARDAKGTPIYKMSAGGGSAGGAKSIVLTIDRRLQQTVEKYLAEALQNTSAKRGVAIVMDPHTGEILAFALLPHFISPASGTISENYALSEPFDPGSIFKPFLIAGALDAGVVKPGSKIYCEDGSYRIGNRVIREGNRKRFGTLTVADIVKHSSNIGCAKIAEKLGSESFYDYISKFGFGTVTGIDIPGESRGLLNSPKRWARVDTANIGFGQGIGVTAIQLVTALSAIANGGNLVQPHLVKRIIDAEGNTVLEHNITIKHRVISENAARQVMKMMEMVVNDDNGTGTLAFSNEIRIAGKTGTAQKYDKNKRAFSRERVVASFEGIMPADNPRLVMLVSLDEPKKDGWGGIAAAPVFQKITEEIMGRNILGMIPQSQVIHSEPLLREPHRKTKMTSRREKRDIIFDKERMPDFQEMSIREVLRIGEELGIVVVSNGSGWAYKQEPPAGAPLGNDAERVCKVYFRI